MSKQYDPTKVGQHGVVLGGVHTSAILAVLYTQVPAGSVAFTSDLGPCIFSGSVWQQIASAASGAADFSNAITPGTMSATQNDYSPTGYVAGTTNQLRLTPASGGTTISGINATGVPDGRTILLK